MSFRRTQTSFIFPMITVIGAVIVTAVTSPAAAGPHSCESAFAAQPARTEATDSNDSSTIDYYNANAAHYAETRGHVSPELKLHRHLFLQNLNRRTPREILEVGAGHGRDAAYFEALGHRVTATEPTPELAAIAEKKLRQPVLRLRAEDIGSRADFIGKFDGVWAMASLIHVPTNTLPSIFTSLKQTLKIGGVIHASFLKGVGTPDVAETLPDGRYFNRVSETKLREIIGSIPGLRVLEELSRSQEDDYFGAAAPTSTFGFYNLYVIRDF